MSKKYGTSIASEEAIALFLSILWKEWPKICQLFAASGS